MSTGPAENEQRRWNLAGYQISSGYLWHFGAIGAYVPFATLYFKKLGFSGAEIGVLAALFAVGTAFVAPLAGVIADARGLHRSVIRLSLVGAVVLALALSQVTAFWPFLLLTTLFAIFVSPVSSQLDGYAMTVSEKNGASYGRLRVWGSAGFTLAVLAVGQWMGDDVDRKIYYATAIGFGLALISVLTLPRLGHQARPNPLSGFGEVWRNKPLALLLIVALISALGTAVANNFLGIHLEELDGSARLVGPAFAIGAASELPVMLLAGTLMRRIQPFWLIAASLLVYAVRFAIYGLSENADLVLALQSLHGLSYALFLTATVTLAFRLAGPSLSATAQALLTAMSFGFGSIAGSLIGGLLLDSVGTSVLFQGAAVLLLISLAVLVIGNRSAPLTEPAPAAEMSAR